MFSSLILRYIFVYLCFNVKNVTAQDVLGCGGFVKSEVEINFSLVEVKIARFLILLKSSLTHITHCHTLFLFTGHLY